MPPMLPAIDIDWSLASGERALHADNHYEVRVSGSTGAMIGQSLGLLYQLGPLTADDLVSASSIDEDIFEARHLIQGASSLAIDEEFEREFDAFIENVKASNSGEAKPLTRRI